LRRLASRRISRLVFRKVEIFGLTAELKLHSQGDIQKNHTIIMKLKHLFSCILAASGVLAFTTAFGQGGASVEVITSFDYPGDVTQTIPEGINDRGDITGFYVDTNGTTRGFIRFHAGTFSPPIVEPNDPGLLSEGRGINHSRVVAGFYSTTDGTFHGYLLDHGTFTEFDVPGSTNTYVEGINDQGDFVGAEDSTGALLAYKNLDGTTETIDISGATASYAFGINRKRECTGQYTDSGGIIHGYFADASGAITTFDPPLSTGTYPFGLNNRALIVGRYAGADGVNHAFVLKLPHGFAKFDFPGAVFTSLNGINNDGMLCGRYDLGDGIIHGFLGRLVTNP
jgi:hypothetical protein